MYKPSYLFDRTPEEKIDQLKSWERGDQAFFASGACHILAEQFVQLYGDQGFYKVHIKPAEGFSGNHVYATDGEGLLIIMAGQGNKNSCSLLNRRFGQNIHHGAMSDA